MRIDPIDKLALTARTQEDLGIQYHEWAPEPAPRIDLLLIGIGIGVLFMLTITGCVL